MYLSLIHILASKVISQELALAICILYNHIVVQSNPMNVSHNGATFLIGTLFAVFGQIYQTGADAYDLFLGWTLFTILWAVAIRFAPL